MTETYTPKAYTIYIDYKGGTPELDCVDLEHHHSDPKIGKTHITELKKGDTLTLQMRNFPGDCSISAVKFYDTADYVTAEAAAKNNTTPTTPVGTFTPATSATPTTITKDQKNDFKVEVKDKPNVAPAQRSLTKVIITDEEDITGTDEDDFWFAVEIAYKDSTGSAKTAVLDPELINKSGGKGPNAG